MNDNALMEVLLTTLTAGLLSQNITVGIEQEYHPVQEGIPTADTLYIFKIGDNRYGSPYRQDIFDNATNKMTHTETEIIETAYQMNALVTQKPANITQITSADYLKAVANVLQSEFAITTLIAVGVGIYRIRNIRQTYFQNDRNEFEANPSLDFTVTHTCVSTWIIPNVATLIPNILDP